MKLYLIVLSVGWLCTSALGQGECPKDCTCSDGEAAIARCTELKSEMLFSERIKHLVVESVPGLQINLTKAFFKKIGLQQVISIKITNCSFSYIDDGAFEGLEQLTDVNLSDNGLILIHPDTFQFNSQLEHLELSGNPLQLAQLLEAEDNYFLKSKSLLELDLSRCQLSDIGQKFLSQVPRLQYLNLKSNNIKVIDDYIFENVGSLEELDMSNNMLMSVNDEFFEDIDELTTLILKNNSIEHIDEWDMPGLKELDVSYNNIKLLKKTTFENMPELFSLNISHNEITWISEGTFKDLIELRHLDLSHNALMGPLPKIIFEENEFLETLSLGGNKYMHTFEGFSTELPKLYQLDISNCGLSNITNSSFNGLPSLATLNISSNVLTSLNHVMMSKLHRLNTLDLSYNDITKVGTYTFASNSHLRKLDLSHNKIHHLSPNTFETTPYVSHLDLSHNQFSHIWHANDSEYMKDNNFLNQLEYLNIAGNRIKVLHKHSFGHLTNLKAIDVLDNPLECTSEFPAFIEWLYTKHIGPLNYVGKSAQLEEKLEKSNRQWDDLLLEVCKQKTEGIEIKTEPIKGEEVETNKEQDLNFYQYTVIEDVKMTEAEQNREAAATEEKEKIIEELDNYMWPTFLIVFAVVFITLAVGNTIALVIYRNRNQYSSAGFKTALVTPFKRTVVKVDTTPRYHKLYEECSVPNTPIVKNNLLGNLINSKIKSGALSNSKNNDV